MVKDKTNIIKSILEGSVLACMIINITTPIMFLISFSFYNNTMSGISFAFMFTILSYIGFYFINKQ